MSDAAAQADEPDVGTLPGWDLNDLYPGPNSSELKQDLAAMLQRLGGRASVANIAAVASK